MPQKTQELREIGQKSAFFAYSAFRPSWPNIRPNNFGRIWPNIRPNIRYSVVHYSLERTRNLLRTKKNILATSKILQIRSAMMKILGPRS